MTAVRLDDLINDEQPEPQARRLALRTLERIKQARQVVGSDVAVVFDPEAELVVGGAIEHDLDGAAFFAVGRGVGEQVRHRLHEPVAVGVDVEIAAYVERDRA